MLDSFVVDVLRDLHDISALVDTFFKNEEKTTLWLNTPNPLLGNQVPVEMIFKGRTEKLRNFIDGQLAQNFPLGK
jgi:uncharacterized protein (DUF2384 family)